MTALASVPRWTVAQYLEMERASGVRHEYVDGAVYALAGGTRAHSVVGANVIALLRIAVRGGPCRVHTADMKVRVTPARYLYPDASVACEAVDRADDQLDWLAAPRVVVEVLSESTAEYDRGDKFALYRQNAALRDYVLVETASRAVEVRSRGADGTWTTRRFGAGATVELPGLGASFAVAAVYEDVAVDGA
jgi:Uma2 family endonuclease